MIQKTTYTRVIFYPNKNALKELKSNYGGFVIDGLLGKKVG